MNEAAKHLFLSQPSLSETIKELEQEIGMQIFLRSNRGIVITPEGEEFLGYARQVTEQFGLLQSRYVEKQTREKFSVSMSIIHLPSMRLWRRSSGRELTVTNLRRMRRRPMMSWRMCAILRVKIGVLYLNDFNEKVMTKIIHEKGLEFTELFACDTYVYLWNGHPLASKAVITMEELDEYPCLSFESGKEPFTISGGGNEKHL